MNDQPQSYRWKDPNLGPNAPALYLYFLQESHVNVAETEKAGVQTYDNVLVGYIAPTPQSKSNAAHEIRRTLPDGTVKNHPIYSMKYAEQLKHYDANVSAESLGTPLRDLIGMTPATIMNLKARGVATVETLAEMPDSMGTELMGFWELRDRAKKHLELREKEAPMVRMAAIEERHKNEVDALHRQIEDLSARVEAKAEKRGPGRPPKVQEAA